jgi:hypothetical protein
MIKTTALIFVIALTALAIALSSFSLNCGAMFGRNPPNAANRATPNSRALVK